MRRDAQQRDTTRADGHGKLNESTFRVKTLSYYNCFRKSIERVSEGGYNEDGTGIIFCNNVE